MVAPQPPKLLGVGSNPTGRASELPVYSIWLKELVVLVMKNGSRLRGDRWSITVSGGVAHLVERLACTEKAAGSIPVTSTRSLILV